MADPKTPASASPAAMVFIFITVLVDSFGLGITPSQRTVSGRQRSEVASGGASQVDLSNDVVHNVKS